MADSKSADHAEGIRNFLQTLRIDTLITKHRSEFELAIANEQDLMKLPNESLDGGAVKNHLVNWCLIKFTDHVDDDIRIILIGTGSEDRMSWCTSRAIALDRERNLIRTKSGSLYAVDGDPVIEPPVHLVLHVAATFRAWGLGDMLGMPAVFY